MCCVCVLYTFLDSSPVLLVFIRGGLCFSMLCLCLYVCFLGGIVLGGCFLVCVLCYCFAVCFLYVYCLLSLRVYVLFDFIYNVPEFFGCFFNVPLSIPSCFVWGVVCWIGVIVVALSLFCLFVVVCLRVFIGVLSWVCFFYNTLFQCVSPFVCFLRLRFAFASSCC